MFKGYIGMLRIYKTALANPLLTSANKYADLVYNKYLFKFYPLDDPDKSHHSQAEWK
jgi:hypothetical protein